MAKLRCPRCNSLVPFGNDDLAPLCTVCGFSGPAPGRQSKDTLKFPAPWKPGQAEATKPTERWVLVREPGDAPKPTAQPAAKPAGGPPPRKPIVSGDARPRAALKASPPKPLPAPKGAPAPAKAAKRKTKGHGRMPWWLYALLSVLTLGLFAVYAAVRRRR